MAAATAASAARRPAAAPCTSSGAVARGLKLKALARALQLGQQRIALGHASSRSWAEMAPLFKSSSRRRATRTAFSTWASICDTRARACPTSSLR